MLRAAATDSLEVVVLARVDAAHLVGVDGHLVVVEVHVANGLPSFTVVGLPDAAVRESRDRVRAALVSSGLRWPQRRVTVNLAPSGERKGGPGLDLPIAVALLAAHGDLPAGRLEGLGFIGELGLDGSVRPVPGTIPLVRSLAGRTAVVPAASFDEAAAVAPGQVRPVASLSDVVAVLREGAAWPAAPRSRRRPAAALPTGDLRDVRGQHLGRRAVEVAAAGGHHLLLVGPPGCGKTMLATRLPGLLPALGEDQMREVAAIWSAAGLPLGDVLAGRPPFRAPHHSVTASALIGGGGQLRPGEVTLAHGGVLFLDELAEVPAGSLEALREPLESGQVRLVRAGTAATLPARFQLVAATNPCPCGEGTVRGACRCADHGRARYARRLSAALLDRFDLAVVLARPDPSELVGGPPGQTGRGGRGPIPEPTACVAERVAAARRRADRRGRLNAHLDGPALDQVAPLSAGASELLLRRVRGGRLSGRAVARVRAVARTIADLAGAVEVDEEHVAEALALRSGREVLAAAAGPAGGGW